MAARKGLAAEVEGIVSEAADAVRALVREALRGELGGMLGSMLGDEARKARKPAAAAAPKAARKGAAKASKKAGKKAAKKAGGKKRGRAAAGTAVSEEKVKALAELVTAKGPMPPATARKALRLEPVQMQHVARAAAEQKLIKVTGVGRGTQYSPA